MERVQQILRRMQRKARAGQTVQEAIEDAFRRFDTSHDGQLQFGEFYNALTNMVGSVNHMDANLLFRAIDTNDSGSIAISEFRDAIMHPAGYRARLEHVVEHDPEEKRQREKHAELQEELEWMLRPNGMGEDGPIVTGTGGAEDERAEDVAGGDRSTTDGRLRDRKTKDALSDFHATRKTAANRGELLRRLRKAAQRAAERERARLPLHERVSGHRSEVLSQLSRRALQRVFERRDTTGSGKLRASTFCDTLLRFIGTFGRTQRTDTLQPSVQMRTQLRSLWQQCEGNYVKFISQLFDVASRERKASEPVPLQLDDTVPTAHSRTRDVAEELGTDLAGIATTKSKSKRTTPQVPPTEVHSERPELGTAPWDQEHVGERDVRPPSWHKIPRKLRYRHCKTLVAPPTQWDISEMTRSAQLPDVTLSLEHVYGYRGGARPGRSLHILQTREIVYYTAALGIVLNPQTNKQRFFMGHSSDITCIAVHPDGRTVVTGQSGKHPFLCVWDAVSEDCDQIAEVGALPVPKKEMERMCRVTEDGIEYFDGKPRSSKSDRKYVSFYEREIACCTFSTDGDILAAIGGDNKHMIGIWDWRRGTLLAEAVTRNDIRSVFDIVWAPPSAANGSASSKFATFGKGHIKFWDVSKTASKSSGGALQLQAISGNVGAEPAAKAHLCLCYDRQGDPISGGRDIDGNGRLYFWNAAGQCKSSMVVHEGVTCNAIVLSDIGDLLYTGGGDGVVHRWKTTAAGTSGEPYVWQATSDPCMQSGDDQAKQRAHNATDTARAVKHRALLGVMRDTMEHHDHARESKPEVKYKHSVRALAVQQNGEVIVGTTHGCIFSLPPDAGFAHPQLKMAGHYRTMQALASHPIHEGIFVTAGEDCQVLVWSATRCELVGATVVSTPVQAAAIHPDGTKIVAGCINGMFEVLDSQSMRTIAKRRDVSGAITDIKFSPHADFLAVASQNGWIDIYNPTGDTYQKLRRCKGHTSLVAHIDWSVDSRILQSNSSSNEIIYFDVTNGRPIREDGDILADTKWHTWTCTLGFPVMGVWPASAARDDINAACMTNDQRFVVTADDFGKVKVFNAPCVVHRAPCREYWGHASHVTNVRFLSGDTHLISVGGRDASVFQWRVEPTVTQPSRRWKSTRAWCPPPQVSTGGML